MPRGPRPVIPQIPHHIIHRGNKFGGGKPGMTKELFWSKYKGPAKYADDGGKDNEVAIIAKIGEVNFVSNIANFVRWMAQLKGNL